MSLLLDYFKSIGEPYPDKHGRGSFLEAYLLEVVGFFIIIPIGIYIDISELMQGGKE